jgi:hypothetical protein
MVTCITGLVPLATWLGVPFPLFAEEEAGAQRQLSYRLVELPEYPQREDGQQGQNSRACVDVS